MARIELSNIGGGGGTTLSLTTTGTSGASTLGGSVLNIPIYQGQLTLTTTGTSGAATLVGDVLNIPQYSGGGTPAGSAGQVQFNSTPAGSFAASANLAWDNTAVQLNINAPASPTGKLNVKGSGTLTTVNTRLTDSGNTELLKVLDSGSTNIGANFNWDNVNGRLGLGTSTPAQTLEVSGAMRLTGTAGTAAFMLGRNSAGDVSAVTLGTTGTSGAATLSANVLNIPQYQGALTLTTTGTSGAATLVGNTLNIPQYSGGGGTPAGATGEIQYNNAGAFAASANLAWDNSNVRLNIGAPSAPNSRLNIKGSGATSSTSPLTITNSSDVENFRFFDNSVFRIGNSSVINSATVEVNSGLDAFIKTIIFKAQGNSTTAIDIRAAGTSTGFPSLNMYDTEAATSGNAMFIGRGGWNLPSTGITFIGNLVPGVANANSQHFGFMVSSVALGRFQAMQIFNSGNVILQNSGTYTDAGYKLDIISASSTHALRVRAPNTNGGTNALLVQNNRSPTPDDIYKIEANGKISYLATNTAAGSTGAQTINRPSGTVNFAAGASALVVTNSLCTVNSIVFATVRTNDATAYIKNVVPAALGGSFTINLGAAATAETSVGFFIIN